MITTDYLRGQRALVPESNPALFSGSVPNALIQSRPVLQWRIVLSRRTLIALKSLNETDRKTVSDVIDNLRKIPTPHSLSTDQFRAIDTGLFSIVFVRRGEVIEVTDVLSRPLLNQFIRNSPTNL